MPKNYIKDKEKTVNALNQLFSFHGNAKELATSIDKVLLSYVENFVRSGESGGDWIADLVYDLREVRDFFNEVETINN